MNVATKTHPPNQHTYELKSTPLKVHQNWHEDPSSLLTCSYASLQLELRYLVSRHI